MILGFVAVPLVFWGLGDFGRENLCHRSSLCKWLSQKQKLNVDFKSTTPIVKGKQFKCFRLFIYWYWTRSQELVWIRLKERNLNYNEVNDQYPSTLISSLEIIRKSCSFLIPHFVRMNNLKLSPLTLKAMTLDWKFYI